jgi:hypothetical protein
MDFSNNTNRLRKSLLIVAMRLVASFSFVAWNISWFRGDANWELFGIAAYLMAWSYLEELTWWTSQR